ncbi:MAG: hypothetical protein AAGF23_11090, partial [Acidobacteriota bacterium]
MLTFLTAFLGLVIGVETVELEASADVAAVELRLDGAAVVRLDGPPWRARVDFGPTLEPHRLEAVGFDADGRPVGSTELWVNLPQLRSQATIVVKEEAHWAGVVWHSADGVFPDGWRFSFDGEPFTATDPRGFVLPTFDPETPHLLQAELRFGRRTTRAEAIVGGPAGDLIDTQLTALVYEAKGGAPGLDELRGGLLVDGRPLHVVSAERPGGEVVMVQDATPATWGALNRLRRDALKLGNRSFINARLTSGLHDDEHLRVILPLAERVGGAALEQFHISSDFGGYARASDSIGPRRGEIAEPEAKGILAALPYPPEGPLVDAAPRRTAEAVAVAAQAASASRRPRAVVLVRDASATDHGAHLQVPLFVWSPAGGLDERDDRDGWGARRDVSTFRTLQRAVIELRETLDRQVVVWVRGGHRPQDVALSPDLARRLRPVGGPAAPSPPAPAPTLAPDATAGPSDAPDPPPTEGPAPTRPP